MALTRAGDHDQFRIRMFRHVSAPNRLERQNFRLEASPFDARSHCDASRPGTEWISGARQVFPRTK